MTGALSVSSVTDTSSWSQSSSSSYILSGRPRKLKLFIYFQTFLFFNFSSLTACPSAYPMFLNPPNQFFENLMGIPLSKELKDIIKI